MSKIKNDLYQGGSKINHLDFRPIEVKIESIIPIKFIEIPLQVQLPNSMVPSGPQVWKSSIHPPRTF